MERCPGREFHPIRILNPGFRLERPEYLAGLYVSNSVLPGHPERVEFVQSLTLSRGLGAAHGRDSLATGRLAGHAL